MKKILTLSFAALLTIAFTVSSFAADSGGGKKLVVYYSLSGNTRVLAEYIHEIVGGDMAEIKTVNPYPANFHAVVDQAREERSKNFLPPILPIANKLSDYDTLYLGFPVWSNSIPQAMKTFLSKNNLAGKTIIPFCTHDGYGVGHSFQAIAEASPNAEVLDGFDIVGADVGTAKPLLAPWLGKTSASNADGTPIVITVGDKSLSGTLGNSPEAREFISMLPVSVSMSGYGNREYYGGISKKINASVEGQLHFADGDITYCPQNNTVAIFYAQTDRPKLGMRVIPLGRVTSNLSVFHNMGGSVQMTFSLAN
jgi:flavodoxin